MDPVKQFDVVHEFAQIGVDVRHRANEVADLLVKFYFHIRKAEDFLNSETGPREEPKEA